MLIPLGGYYYKKNKEYRNNFSLVWKSSDRLNPKDLMGERPYEELYHEREIDRQITSAISANRSFIIAGSPLSGKTRAVFNALKNSPQKHSILFPRNISMPQPELPFDLKFSRHKIIFIDDFQNFIEKQDNFMFFLKAAIAKNIPVIATCHSGREFRKTKNKLLEQNADMDIIFNDVFEIEKISSADGIAIAKQVGRKWDDVKFNGTIGSIFMKLSEMERRYDQCDTIEKTILRSLRDLYACGIYETNCEFKIQWLKKVASRYELEGKDFEWTGWLKNLEDKEFVAVIARNKVWAEDAYLEYIIDPESRVNDLSLFEDMLKIFNDDAEVLIMTGERVYDSGTVSAGISGYMRTSIMAFERVLTLNENNGDKSIDIKANLYIGMAYWNLSKLEDTINNCEQSLRHYENVLKMSDRNARPEEFALIMSRIGNSYSILSESVNKPDNCRRSIEAFNEALNIYDKKDHPNEYAQVNNSLGGAYLILSDVENSKANILKALKCFERSLQIRKPENDPKGYAFSVNNIAGVFARLSQIEDPEKNLETALAKYQEALKIYSKEKYELQYGMTLNNIGNVYSLFSNIRNKKEFAVKAIEAYEKALEVRTRGNAPLQNSSTLYNLADAFLIMHESDGDIKHLHDAVNALENSIQPVVPVVRRSEILTLLGKTYFLLAEKESREENRNNGIMSFDKAIDLLREYPDKQKEVIGEKNELLSRTF